jgi:hypothetical protein
MFVGIVKRHGTTCSQNACSSLLQGPQARTISFRLIKPGMAASGRRFAVVDGADAAVTLRCSASRAAMIRNTTLPHDHVMAPIDLKGVVKQCENRSTHA